MKPKIIDIEQGTPDWLSLRRNKVTATDTAKIMGLNPWCTAYQCWEEKLGFKESQTLNEKMKEGSLLEEEARNSFNDHMDTDYKPIVLEHGKNAFQIASLDGMNSNNRILEIKCGVSSHEMAKRKEIAPYYQCQLQKQMYVADTDRIYFISFRSNDDWFYWEVYRDDKFIKEMNEKENIFYFENLMNLIPPEMTNKDYVIREDFQWSMHVEEYKNAKEQFNMWKAKEEHLRASLISLANGKSTKGLGVTVSKVIRKGVVDYNSIPEIKSIDLEKYRKEPTTYMSIRND